MSDEHPTIGDLTYELLKRVHAEFGELRSDVLELKRRATATGEHLSGVFIQLVNMNGRIDRFDTRLERIERRLDLVEAH